MVTGGRSQIIESYRSRPKTVAEVRANQEAYERVKRMAFEPSRFYGREDPAELVSMSGGPKKQAGSDGSAEFMGANFSGSGEWR